MRGAPCTKAPPSPPIFLRALRNCDRVSKIKDRIRSSLGMIVTALCCYLLLCFSLRFFSPLQGYFLETGSLSLSLSLSLTLSLGAFPLAFSRRGQSSLAFSHRRIRPRIISVSKSIITRDAQGRRSVMLCAQCFSPRLKM